MATVFQNPSNGYTEQVSGAAWLWTLLFGFFYLAAKSLWMHVFIQLAVFIFFGAVLGPALLIIGPIVWIGYAIAINSILEAKYRRMGWREISYARTSTIGLGPEAAAAVERRDLDRALAAARPPTPATAAAPAAPSVADEITKLAGLLDKGLITQDEFAAQKMKLLGGAG